MNRAELVKQIFEKGTYLCVGLDTDPSLLPSHIDPGPEGMLQFNKAIIEATLKHCVSYKINTAFYEALGAEGWKVLEETIKLIPSTHLIIADAKRGDIGNTSTQYAKAFFERLNCDAITVAPYMGKDSVEPFLQYGGKWTIVLGLTSNPGSMDFEKLKLEKDAGMLYEKVLLKTSTWGNKDNLMFVIGATQASEFDRIRQILPEFFFLVPGVGAQGGSLREISERAMTSECGLLVNVSRAIIYASKGEDFAREAGAIAEQYAYEMKHYLEKINS